MKINRLSPDFGAEIEGVDAAHGLGGATLAAIKDAFISHRVVVIRDQTLAPQDQAAFSRQFGTLEVQGNELHHLADCPDVLVLSNERDDDGKPVGVVDAGDFWHSDLPHRPTPTMATVLYALKLPAVGGDTEFADMYAAYDHLPSDLKTRIAGLKGINCSNKLINPRVTISPDRPGAAEYYAESAARNPPVAQPIARTHPVTGKKALFISPRFTIGIEGMDDDEAQPLLDDLFERQLQPEFIYHHKWRLHDLVMWDNRCVLHWACGGYKYPNTRRMHRTTIKSDVPF